MAQLMIRYFGETNEYPISNFSITSPNIVMISGEDFPVKSGKGFYITRQGKGDNWDYTEYKTIYRRLDGATQFSNDGSIYVDPTKDVVVSVSFDEGGATGTTRPTSVDVDVTSNKGFSESITLSDENDWKKTYYSVPMDASYSVSCDDVEGYTKQISGTSILFYVPQPQPGPVPSDLEQRVQALENEIEEIDDAIGGVIK